MLGKAERQQGVRVVGGELLGGVDGPVELPLRLDDVVGRQHDQGGVRVGAGDQGRPQPDARGRVPPLRLADDVTGGQFRQLPGRLAGVGGGGQHPGPLGRHPGGDAVERPLQEGAVAAEAEELFRPGGAAAGPEPGTAAAGHDHRVEHRAFVGGLGSAGARNVSEG